MYFTQTLQQIIHIEFYIKCYVFTCWRRTELQRETERKNCKRYHNCI